MPHEIRLLIAEDRPEDADLAVAELRRDGLRVAARRVDEADAFAGEIDAFLPDVILSDYSMPQFSGLDALEIARRKAPLVPFIVYTGSLDEETAAACIKAGAWEYVTLRVAVEPPGLEVRADLRRMKQVLVNLLSNAVKFTPPGGEVGVAVAREDGWVRIVVHDTGIGIAPEHLPLLFQPFRQLDSRLAREHDGTGLGLALVRRLVEAHGGSVAIDSTLGQGTRVTVHLLDAAAEPAPTSV